MIQAADILLNPLIWLGCLIVLFFSLLVGATRSRRRQSKGNDRQVNEAFRLAMRAVQDAREKQEGTEGQSAGDDKPKPANDSLAHFGHAPMRRRSTDTPDVTVSSARLAEEEAAALEGLTTGRIAHDAELYFEPFVNFQNGRVSYYNVYLKRSNVADKKQIFDKSYSGSDPHTGATFDHMLIERAVTASRQVFATLGNESRLIVPCSANLLASDRHWRALMQLFAAQNSLLSGLVFAVDANVLSDTQSRAYARIGELHQRGADLACRGFEVDLDRADHEFLLEVEGVISGLTDAFRLGNAPETADRKSVEALRFFQSARMPLFIEDIVTDSDAADAIDLLAKHGAGPFFGQPRRLRDDSTELPLTNYAG